MNYTEDDIRRAVSQNALAAGRLYQTQGRVLSFDVDGSLITSRVQGNERRPYEQTIVVERSRGGMADIEGECTCPVGFNCKHVAAALFAALPGAARGGAGRAVQPALPALQPAARPPVPVAHGSGLPPSLAAWLDELAAAQDTGTEDYPPTVPQRLVYVLAPLNREPRAPQLRVDPVSTRLLKDGRFSDAGRTYAGDISSAAPAAKFLRPSDLHILDALARLKRSGRGTGPPLSREGGAAVLADILATGRARWLSVNGPALAPGEPRQGTLAWRSRDGASLQPILDLGPEITVLHAAPPLYVDAAATLIGPIETGLPPRVAAGLLDAPPVPAGEVATLSKALRQRLPGLAGAHPPEPEATEVIAEAPVPCLRLCVADLPAAGPYAITYGFAGFAAVTERVPVARLSFRYGPVSVAAGETGARVTRYASATVYEVRRNLAAERRYAAALLLLGFAPARRSRARVPEGTADALVLDGDEMDWLDLLYGDLPALEAQGWRVEIADDFPFRVLRGGSFSAEVHEGSGIDWFELGLGVLVDGERVDLVGPIVALLGTPGFDPAAWAGDSPGDEPLYLRLGDGRILGVPAERLLPIVEAIAALAMGGSQLGDGRLRLGLADATGLAALEAAAGLVWQGGDRLREMARRLGPAGGIPAVALPPWFAARLRPYQADGVAWLAFLRELSLGGVLADDMGLGKTVQALALIAGEKAAGRLDTPALVIAPTSLMANWRAEAARFAPDLRVLVLHGLDRRSHFGEIADSDLVLTTYPLVARDHEVLSGTHWHLMLLDEAQTVKNPEAATTKLVAGLKARHRFALTGTPIENNLGELWSLFSIVLPGFLGDRHTFTRVWRTPIEKGDAARAKLLARRVKPFLLRRTKEEVARDLPPKTETVERVDLEKAQRDVYESIRLSMHGRVRDAVAKKGFARSRIEILDALLKLRQACCDPRLLKLASRTARQAGSAKLDRLMEMLDELVAEGRRVLVFSQFTSMLDLIRVRLDTVRVDYALLTGRTRDRPAAIRQFQEGRAPVFLVSLKAGGTGLNLTTADTVILYDPWWNPAVEDQAVDRAHRIGQDKPVFVHKLVAVGTVEEKMEIMKEKKRALADSLFDQDGGPTLAMTESDLEALFEA